jgi:hypothetical protein
LPDVSADRPAVGEAGSPESIGAVAALSSTASRDARGSAWRRHPRRLDSLPIVTI